MRIPSAVTETIDKLVAAGYEAWLVGGCVRDVIMGHEPKDWDITTDARPERILAVFPEGKYENNFGTVIIPIKQDNIDAIEITTYRSEQGYNDRRHPDNVVFEDRLDKDLERRDFTVNAMALGQYEIKNYELKITEISIDERKYGLVDLFGGVKDIKNKIIRAVGEPEDRFKEDALRLMRAVRFACQLGFEIEPKTERAIVKMAGGLKFVAQERIQAELIKILASNFAYEGIMTLHRDKLLQYIIPELERGVGVAQNRHHIHTVFKHSVLSLKECPSADWRVKFAALLHDIAKPITKADKDGDATFYNHDIVGAKIVKKIMLRMKFPTADIEKVTNLVRNHMFYYNVGEVTESSVRRLIRKVGYDNLQDLIDLRIADRLGSGVPKAKPYKLRHLEYMMKKVQTDPVSVKMLKINGDDLIKILSLEPGPKIGAILDVLLSEVIEDPALNEKGILENMAQELNSLDLTELRERAKEKIEEKKMEDDQELKNDFKV